jgi:hypothetical protein
MAIERIDRRDRAHAELARNAGMLVDIDLHQLHLAARAAHGFLQRRAELAAGPAPGGPEVHDHGLGARGLDDVRHEALVGAFLDEVGGRRRSAVENGHAESLRKPSP